MAGEAGWTDDRVELLKQLWAKGDSASQIAKQLGAVSRCAVLGKVHRLKLARRKEASAAPYGRTVIRRQRSLIKRFSKPKSPKPPTLPRTKRTRPTVVPLDPPVMRNLTLMQLNDWTCRYPVGEATGVHQLFCGAPIHEWGHTECPYHHFVCWQPLSSRQMRIADRAERVAA